MCDRSTPQRNGPRIPLGRDNTGTIFRLVPVLTRGATPEEYPKDSTGQAGQALTDTGFLFELAADTHRLTQTFVQRTPLDKNSHQKVHEAQLLNYLKATGMHVGLLINITHPKAEIKRMVFNLPEGHDTNYGDRSSP